MIIGTEKREKTSDVADALITSISLVKRQRISKREKITVDTGDSKTSVRRDSLLRRVSTSGDQSTLDLEDELFSPTIKIDEKKRKSLHHRNSLAGDSDSSYSNISVNQELSSIDLNRFDPSLNSSLLKKSKTHISPSVSLLEENEDSILGEGETSTIHSTDVSKANVPITEIVTKEVEEDGDDEWINLDELDDETYSMLIIRMLPMYSTIEKSLLRHNLLPPKSESAPLYTLVLDLDETLVHCVMEPIETYDIKFEITYNDGSCDVYALFRPFVNEFLQAASQFFEIVVFTASQQCYADSVINILDKNQVINHRLYRQQCLYVDENYVKDLKSLNRDLKKTVIIDNSMYAFGYQLDNGIPISSWFDDKEDEELKNMIPLLHTITTKKDIRPFLRSKYKIRSKVQTMELPF